MSIVGRIEQILNSNLEIILIGEEASRCLASYIVNTGKEIYGWLLIAGRWGFEIGQCALELESVFHVLQKLVGDSCVERHACQAVVSLFGEEDIILSLVSRFFILVAAKNLHSELRISAHGSDCRGNSGGFAANGHADLPRKT